jgi:hypothetical protein
LPKTPKPAAGITIAHASVQCARVPSVVEKEKGVFSRYRKTETGSWGESDRGGIRL